MISPYSILYEDGCPAAVFRGLQARSILAWGNAPGRRREKDRGL